jgi:hypothetical protein
MLTDANNSTSVEGLFNTLGINGKSKVATVKGVGCNISTEKARERRGKTKFIDIKLSLALADVARSEKDYKFVKKCFRTYFCLSTVIYQKGRIYGKLCRTRFCSTCNGIRKADLINQYFPIIKYWKNPYFLTLTTKSVEADKLENLINEQKTVFNRIIDKFEKRSTNGINEQIICLRSHECNFNPKENWYNPHFHIVTPDLKTALILKMEWKKAFGKLRVSDDAQKVIKIKDLEKNLIEVLKYGTKIFTDPDAKKGIKGKNYKLYARAYYTIVKAFEGKHIVAHYGFKLPQQKRNQEKKETILTNPSTLKYLPSVNDWVNKETGSMLTWFSPDEDLCKLIAEIDKELY